MNNLHEVFELNHDLLNVLHEYSDLEKSELSDEDFDEKLANFAKSDRVAVFFNFEDSHDAMNLWGLYKISETCVENESIELKQTLSEWVEDNRDLLTTQTKELLTRI